MIKELEIEQPKKLTEEQEEQQYWDLLKFNSHKWIETYKGYYTCEFCNISHTSAMPMNGQKLCSKNPHILTTDLEDAEDYYNETYNQNK